MSKTTKASSAVAYRYAAALIDLAEESKKLDKVEKDLGDLRAMIADSADLTHFIHSPLIGQAERTKALQALAEKAKFQDLTKNFLSVLSENGRLNALEAVIEAVYAELSRRRGEVSVQVQTAQDLTAKQKKDLEAAIAKGIGSDISLQAKLSPEIMGGMIVTVGSYMIDESVARKLERLKAAMSKQSNQNTVNLEEVG